MVNEVVRITEIAPETPASVIDMLVDAYSNIQWEPVDRDVSEKEVFEAQYAAVTQYYYSGAGGNPLILDIFRVYKPIVEAWVKLSLRGEKVPGEPLNAILKGETATGTSEAFLRPLTLRTFANAAYEHIPSTTGSYDLIPNTTGTESATTKEQSWIILGYMDPLVGNVVPYDEIQENVNDGIGIRKPLYPRLAFAAQGPNNIKVFKRPSPLLVLPGNTLDINVYVRTANVKFGLWPIGFEVIRADAAEATGPLG